MQMCYYAKMIVSSTHTKLAKTLFVLTSIKSERMKAQTYNLSRPAASESRAEIISYHTIFDTGFAILQE